jgi:glycosyltransferase involved in cell wall biosynthesis
VNFVAKPLFTVFTPTYNQAHLLPRLFEALLQQTLRDFEWLIVDDDSADGMRELVAGWQPTSPFPIRYYWKKNLGKPSAHNEGVTEARGELFIVQDFDDWSLPHALERFRTLWEEIPPAERGCFTGITVNTSNPDAVVIGARFPDPRTDGTLGDMVASGPMAGDKWGFHSLTALQQFPFPLFEGERFIPEGVVSNRIGRRYQMRFVDEVLKVVECQVGGMTQGIVRTLVRNLRSAWLFYRESLFDSMSLRRRLRVVASAFAMLVRAEVHLRRVGAPRAGLGLLASVSPSAPELGHLTWDRISC